MALDARRGKRRTVSTSEYCRKNGRFDELIQMYGTANERRRGSIAWVMSHAVSKRRWKPSDEQLERIAILLSDEEGEAMAKRGLVDVFQKYRLPRENQGAVADACIRFLRDPNESTAVQAFSITVLFKIIERYPEFFNEVRDVMPRYLNHERPAIQVRMRRAMKVMDKLGLEL